MHRQVAVLAVWLSILISMAACSAPADGTPSPAGSVRDDGPLQPQAEVGNSHPIPAGGSATWAMFLPQNPTTADITLLGAKAVDVTNGEVLGIQFLDPTKVGPPVLTTAGYPPDLPAATGVEGALLPRAGAPDADRMLIIGVRKTGAADATVHGIRLTYEAAGTTYEMILPWDLTLRAPGS